VVERARTLAGKNGTVPRIHVNLINRPDMPSWGAGEMAPTVVPAAISNAVFDAMGARLRSVPFLPAKVRALSTT